MKEIREDSKQYRTDYNRGWSSSRNAAGLDRADADGRSSITAWMDGYLDEAAGREKWHRLNCQDHGSC